MLIYQSVMLICHWWTDETVLSDEVGQCLPLKLALGLMMQCRIQCALPHLICCVLLGCLMALLGGTAAVALTGVAADVHCVTADVCLSAMLACAGVA